MFQLSFFQAQDLDIQSGQPHHKYMNNPGHRPKPDLPQQVVMLAEQMDHHPEWFNVYSRVTIDLTTHEAGGISQRDFDLAKKINEILATMASN